MSLLIFVVAAFLEISGCYAFWAWCREGRSILWLLPGCASLVAFSWLLTLVDASNAGRSYAAYGGIYIIIALVWLWSVEAVRPDGTDLAGAALALAGAAVILFGPHHG